MSMRCLIPNEFFLQYKWLQSEEAFHENASLMPASDLPLQFGNAFAKLSVFLKVAVFHLKLCGSTCQTLGLLNFSPLFACFLLLSCLNLDAFSLIFQMNSACGLFKTYWLYCNKYNNKTTTSNFHIWAKAISPGTKEKRKARTVSFKLKRMKLLQIVLKPETISIVDIASFNVP